MKRGRHRRRTSPVREIRLPDNIDVPRSSEDGNISHRQSEPISLGLRRQAVEVEKVAVPRVVRGEEEAEDAGGVAGGSGDEVGDGRGGCVGGDVGGGREESRVGSEVVGSGVGR